MMGRARIVAVEHLTLDGVMQGPARPDEDQRDDFGHGGWAIRREDPAMQQAMSRVMSEAWSLLVGRVTYQGLLYWPRQQPDSPFTQAFSKVDKFVVSSTLAEPMEWQGSTVLRGGVAEVARLKERHDKNLVIFGSGVLVRSLIAKGLLDDLLLLVHPVVLGSGRRLFTDALSTSLELAEVNTTGTGVVIAGYRKG